MDGIETLKSRLIEDLSSLEGKTDQESAAAELEILRLRYFGKKGEIQGLMRIMGGLPSDQRPAFGKQVNELRDLAEGRMAALAEEVENAVLARKLSQSRVDATRPGIRRALGHLHPLTQLRSEILDFFVALGFEMAEAPEVDHDFFNFEALNMPLDHPARDMHDTFYVREQVVLRTHTSNVQVHYMQSHRNPPIRMIAPGCVYRVDNDATHSPMFQQVECLVVDENISFADLKGTLALWAKQLFGSKAKMRFRPSFFPFTEPSAEMDVSCIFCAGKGCRICKHSGWIEVGGCGSVDPAVFEKVGWDSEKYTGFAFGFGIDRLAMLLYGIPDLALMTRNELRFLKQF